MRVFQRFNLRVAGFRPRHLSLLAVWSWTCVVGAAETNSPLADGWFTNAFGWPSFIAPKTVNFSQFEDLRAEAIAGRLKVYWTPVQMDTNAIVQLFASADEPGHWAVRDWRMIEAIARETSWEAKIPVEDVAVPMAYFLQVTGDGRTNLSPLRMASPRALGLTEPTRIFGPFLEGFEAGARSWRNLTSTNAPLQLAAESVSGTHALQVSVAGQNVPTVIGTTRIRGWQALHPGVCGFSLWLRTRSGSAKASFTLHTDAFSPRATRTTSTFTARLTNEWQRVDIAFDTFPKLELPRVDWLTIEFTAPAAGTVLLDDLQFLGPWPLEPR